jgi:hypothetical protein
MACEVNVTEVSRGWYEDLTRPEQDSVETAVNRLIDVGTGLSFPYSSGSFGYSIRGIRIACCTPSIPKRSAVLLLGGDKTGKDRWYETMVPKADALFAAYLDEL